MIFASLAALGLPSWTAPSAEGRGARVPGVRAEGDGAMRLSEKQRSAIYQAVREEIALLRIDLSYGYRMVWRDALPTARQIREDRDRFMQEALAHLQQEWGRIRRQCEAQARAHAYGARS